MTWTLVAQIWAVSWAIMAGYDLFVKPAQWDRPRNQSNKRGTL